MNKGTLPPQTIEFAGVMEGQKVYYVSEDILEDYGLIESDDEIDNIDFEAPDILDDYINDDMTDEEMVKLMRDYKESKLKPKRK